VGVPPLSSSHATIRFGDFDVDLHSGELRKHGIRIKLQAQPFQVLQMLLEHPGNVVTREELQKRIWPANTFVDFGHGMNNAVKKLREALGDDAEKPRYIETLPKRGYRFIAWVQSNAAADASNQATGSAELMKTNAPGTRRKGFAWGLILGSAAAGALVLVLGLNTGGVRDRLLGKSLAPRIQSLAVLPLQNLSTDPAQEYFSDGMTDALITDLAQVDSLKVISRTSVMRYKKTDKSLSEIARELSVDGIVEGTVQRSGDRVRITAQLIYGPSDKHIWANSYERELEDTLQLQEEVARDIAQRISANLASLSGRHAASPYALNIEAYEDYLKGRNYIRRMIQDDVVKGMDFLQRSIQRDPNYAPAYSELSFANWVLAVFFHRPPGEVVPKSKKAALKALALDENLADAHCLLGLIYGMYEWNWAAGERELTRAIQTDPNSSFTRSEYAFYYLDPMGRKTEAIQEVNTALELDPFSPMQHANASYVFLAARQYDQAIKEGRRAVEIDPGFPPGHLNLASALQANGMEEEGFTEWLRYLSLSGDAALAEELESAAKKDFGQSDPWQKFAQIFLRYYLQKSKSKTQPAWAINIAWAYTYLGDKDKAIEWLDRAYQERSMELYALAVDPSVDPLRSDPRFQDLLRRIGLPP
jgi:TolB-like protein/DNA-binding winged helix-turn-helix (wHTH) protein